MNPATAFVALRTCYQTTSGSNCTITSGNQVVAGIPGDVGKSMMFVDGGTADGARITVQTLASDWSSVPEKLSVVTLSGHSTAPNGNYQLVDEPIVYREGTITFTLGNQDT